MLFIVATLIALASAAPLKREAGLPRVDLHRVSTSSFVALEPVKAAPKPDSILCEVCKLAVGYVEKDLGNNATLSQIENFLEKDVCGIFPKFLRPECNSTVEEYAPQLAHWVVQKEPPATACAKVGLCSSSAVERLTPLVKLEKPAERLTPLVKLETAVHSQAHLSPQSGILCEVCKLIVGFVESSLGKNATLNGIEEFLEKDVCGLFPKFLQAECNSTVAEYAPEIAKFIEQKLPADVVCQKVGLCSSSAFVSLSVQAEEHQEEKTSELAELLKDMRPIAQFQGCNRWKCAGKIISCLSVCKGSVRSSSCLSCLGGSAKCLACF